MDLITLKEMCETLNLTRRTIQCYEKAGLMRAIGKNKYGHLLYDEYCRERATKIRFLQELGFMLKEIRDIIDAPKDVLLHEVENKMEELENKKEQLTELMNKAKDFIVELRGL